MFDPIPIPMICKFCIFFDGAGWCSRLHKEVMMYSFCEDDFELRSKEFYGEEGEGQ